MSGLKWAVVAMACAGIAWGADLSAEIGVAVQKDGAVCLSIANPKLAAGQAMTLVVPDRPQSVIEAVVVSAADQGCPGVANPVQPGYRLRISKGSAPDFQPLIAVARDAGRFAVRNGVVTGRVAAKGTQSFRTCTSAEGVHLTVWDGAPLKGKRLWHQYYYLGMDVEQSCKAKDTVE